MEQKIEEISGKEKSWINMQLEGASKLVGIMAPEAAGQPMTLKLLDRVFAGWMALEEKDENVINAVINQVGITFGQELVERLNLRWVIATDKHGSDLAVYGLPGKGDVLVYPANLVAKRWERRETNFLEACFSETQSQVKALAAKAGEQGNAPRKSGLLKRLFGG